MNMTSQLTEFDIETLCRISGELQAIALKHNSDTKLIDLITSSMRTLRALFEYNDNYSPDLFKSHLFLN